MPGIVGVFTRRPRAWAEAQVEAMLGAIRHEPFYATGSRSNENLGAYVGWTAQPGSFADGMPLENEQGDVALVFSGEEYPDPETRRRLAGERPGPAYLLRAYEQDPAFPAGLNGMFHGLALDQARGQATLFNDRYGMHRLFVHQAEDAFYFAAEAKAILAVKPELRKPDLQSLGEFVACSCVLEDRTLFAGIRSLPAGSAWIFRNGGLEKKQVYFDPSEWERQSPLDARSYYEELRGVFTRNLPRYFSGGQKIGIALTGGLDTRIIMAWRNAAPGEFPCYTFGGMYRECQDVQLARRIAKICRQPHQVITVGREFLQNFPRYAERSIHMTEGTVDVYRASDLYVSELASRIAPVKVVGTYGSEIVRRAVMFKPMTLAEGMFQPEFLPHIEQARRTYAELRRQHPVTFAAFRQSPWYHHGILALEQSQLTVRSPYMDSDFVRAVYRAPQSGDGAEEDVRLKLIADGSRELMAIRSDRGVGGAPLPLLGPLSRLWLEFTFKAEYAYDYGMPQRVAQIDHCFSALHLERLFLGRHKLLHFRVWYRDALAEYVRQMLLDPRTLARPYIERKRLESAVAGHLRGDRNFTLEIHKLLTLELVQRLFFDAR